MSTSDHDPPADNSASVDNSEPAGAASPHGPRPDDPAIGVETTVVESRGRWVVEIVVVFSDGAIRRTVKDYSTRRQAEIAASWIRRAAERDIEGPLHG